MGVPGLYKWIITHTDVLHSLKDMRDKCSLYLDLNGLIHPAARSSVGQSYEEISDAVILKLDALLHTVEIHDLFIAVDGVAPAAKMQQQRARRYKSSDERKKMQELAVKYARDGVSNVDYNMISPGTEFMDLLDQKLMKYILTLTLTYPVIYQGWKIPGEGEHKIINHIRQLKPLKSPMPQTPIVIYGLDADLIQLALLHAPNSYLLRENVEFVGINHIPEGDYIFLSIKKLHEELAWAMNPNRSVNELSKMNINSFLSASYMGAQGTIKAQGIISAQGIIKDTELVADYVCLCNFMGNDFLPHSPAFSIRETNTLGTLIYGYKIIRTRLNEGLVTNKEINVKFLKALVLLFAGIEHKMLLMHKHNHNHKPFYRSYADPYLREIDEYMIINGKNIDFSSSTWETDYYNTTKTDRDSGVQSYYKGLFWTHEYYTSGVKDWSYAYSEFAAPLLRDLARITFAPVVQIHSEPVSPIMQLLCILPPDSAALLPKSVRILMTDKNSPCLYFYPIFITLLTAGKRYRHECPPFLPPIDKDLLLRALNSLSGAPVDHSELRSRTVRIEQ